MKQIQGRLGILVGGGPASGINSAISASTIEAHRQGLEVYGFYDGFEHLIAGRTDMARPVGIHDVAKITGSSKYSADQMANMVGQKGTD